jgi:hypothetical protein
LFVSDKLLFVVQEGGEALIPGLFVIEARNARGELIPMGGFPFSASCVDPHGRAVPVALKDNGDGVVDASYVPAVAGNHIVTVQLGGADIGGAGGPASKSPFKVSALGDVKTKQLMLTMSVVRC